VDQGPYWTDVVTAIASGIAAAGLVLVLVQVREARRSRDAATTADFSRRWDEVPVKDSRDAVLKLGSAQAVADEFNRLRTDKDPKYSGFLAEPNYYEDLAVLCRHGALDKRIVRDSFGTLISERYESWKLVIAELRKTDPKNYEHFETLAKEMRREATGFTKFRRWLADKVKP
jgi:hypothetical protein